MPDHSAPAGRPPSAPAGEHSSLDPPADARRRALEHAADLATQAPSVHDTRPWRIELFPERMAIRADRSRQLTAVDPLGREVAQSIGAALFNARVALASSGWAAQIDRLPDADDPDLLAVVRPVAGTPDTALAALAPAIGRGRTRRREFAAAQVPERVLTRLAALANEEETLLVAVLSEAHRRLVARVTQQADRLQGTDRADTHSCIDQTLVLLATRTDDPTAWVRAGEALEHILLELATHGWVASPLTRAIEVPLTRTQLRSALTWDAHPQMLLQVGVAARTARTARSPRTGAVATSQRPQHVAVEEHPVPSRPPPRPPVSGGRDGSAWGGTVAS